jgi:hypothetical protein
MEKTLVCFVETKICERFAFSPEKADSFTQKSFFFFHDFFLKKRKQKRREAGFEKKKSFF